MVLRQGSNMRRREFIIPFGGAGGDARQVVIDEDTRRNIAGILPPQVPFGSHQWPALITPGPGAKSLVDFP